MTVKAGRHTVQVNLDGYESWTDAKTVSEGQNLPIHAELKREPIAAPAILSFAPAQGTIKKGDRTQLRWETQNATDISIDNGVGTVRTPGGSVEVQPSETTTYTLAARGPGGLAATARTSISVTVPPPPSQPAATSISLFQAIPKSIHQGDKVTIAWATQNAAEVFINRDKVDPNGSKEIQVNESTDFTLTATGPGGTKKEIAHVDVQPPKAPEPDHPVVKPTGPSDEDGIRQARDRWKKQYEAKNAPTHTTFSSEECQSLPSSIGDSVHSTCREKITARIGGSPHSDIVDITFSFTRKGENWEVIGTDFKKAK